MQRFNAFSLKYLQQKSHFLNILIKVQTFISTLFTWKGAGSYFHVKTSLFSSEYSSKEIKTKILSSLFAVWQNEARIKLYIFNHVAFSAFSFCYSCQMQEKTNKTTDAY